MAYGNEQQAWTYKEYVDNYERLEKQRDELLDACDRLEKCLSDNPADYSDMDWFEQVQCNRGKAKVAIAKSETKAISKTDNIGVE